MNLLLAAGTSSVHETEKLVCFTLLELLAILLAARLAGKAAQRLGQPRVVGEIVGGLLLGPSLFGRLLPAQFEFVFHSIAPLPLVILSQIGLVFLMFQIGLEFDFAHLKEKPNRTAMLWVSLAGIVFPFGLGWLIGDWSHPVLAPGINPLGYRLFLGAAMSITAIPILGRIMMELGITKTRLGVIAITAAALNDIAGWTLLAIVSALTVAEFSAVSFLTKLGLLGLHLVFCLLVARPLLRKLVDKLMGTREQIPHELMALMIAVTFVSGLITYSLGVFVIFGGFVVGVLLHDHHRFVAAWNKSVSHFVTVFFLPIFFTYTGLRTNVNGLDSWGLWGWCLIIIGGATIGKFVGCGAAARACGLSWADAGCLGIMMNTRALMELVVINVGYDLGVIPPNVFTMLVLMAIFSTVITAPLLRVYFRMVGLKYELRADV
ncbi:MAG: Na(+)/H(+)-K(+) antiporter GerN [Verrucomicrobiae bacterium]|nr:Na(+)/H(+)-K(+) antiporter GerN [Verrucomicrobiae bacterium]